MNAMLCIANASVCIVMVSDWASMSMGIVYGTALLAILHVCARMLFIIFKAIQG